MTSRPLRVAGDEAVELRLRVQRHREATGGAVVMPPRGSAWKA